MNAAESMIQGKIVCLCHGILSHSLRERYIPFLYIAGKRMRKYGDIDFIEL